MNRIKNLFKDTVRFFQNVVLELKLVDWLGFSQVVKSTVIVAVVVISFIAMLQGMDKLLVAVRELMLDRPII